MKFFLRQKIKCKNYSTKRHEKCTVTRTQFCGFFLFAILLTATNILASSWQFCIPGKCVKIGISYCVKKHAISFFRKFLLASGTLHDHWLTLATSYFCKTFSQSRNRHFIFTQTTLASMLKTVNFKCWRVLSIKCWHQMFAGIQLKIFASRQNFFHRKFVIANAPCTQYEKLFLGYYTKYRVLPGQIKVFLKYFRMIKPQNIKISTTNDVLRTHKVQKWRNASILWLTGLQNNWKYRDFTRQNFLTRWNGCFWEDKGGDKWGMWRVKDIKKWWKCGRNVAEWWKVRWEKWGNCENVWKCGKNW